MICLNNDIKFLRDIFKNSRFKLFLVGGCVRDSVMGFRPHDWDMCTDAEPDEIVMVLVANDIPYHTIGIEYGTVTAIFGDSEYEITTFRKETGYSDSRHPDEVVWTKDIYQDLARRDFTINAIAYDLISEEYLDPYNGIKDINSKILRAVGHPISRFKEDALRILRGIRFAVKYDLNISPSTATSMHICVDGLKSISKERVTDELLKILSCNKPVRGLFIEFGDIISVIFPEIVMCIGMEHNNKYHKHDIYEHMLCVTDLCDTDDEIIKLAALLHDIGKPDSKTTDEEGWSHYYGHPEISWEIVSKIVKNDLVLTVEQSERLLNLVRYHDLIINNSDKAIKRALNKYGENFLRDWLILKRADQDDHVIPDGKTDWRMNLDEIEMTMDSILESNSCFKLKDLALNGNDVMKITGLKPCKKVGEILNILLDEVIDNEIENNYDILSKRVKDLV